MKTTNDICYKVVKQTAKEQVEICIRLNDECKNGHANFSITGTRWEKDKSRTERNIISCGAIGDFIAKKFPQFAIFDRLHLCDRKGATMHASANGFYHLITQEMSADKFCDYYRVTLKQYKELKKSEDENHFKYLLYTLGIVEQWQKEADEGCALLEKLARVKFRDDSTRYQLVSFNLGEREEIEKRLADGYYSDENKKLRADAKRKLQRDKLAAEFIIEKEKTINKALKEFQAKMIVLDSDLPLNNFIFHSHCLLGKFNWKGYEKKVTEEEFEEFLEYAKDKTPEGVTWELEKEK